MVTTFPSNAGGIGGRGSNATEEDIRIMNKFTTNFYHGGTNSLAAESLNHKHHSQLASSHNSRRARFCKQHCMRSHAFLHEPWVGPDVHGSPWDEDQALRSFQGQDHQFDRGTQNRSTPTEHSVNWTTTYHPCSHNCTSTLQASRYAEADINRAQSFNRGTRSFLSRNRPYNNELILITNRKSHRSRQQKRDSAIQVTAHQLLVQAESLALQQMSHMSNDVQAQGKYGRPSRQTGSYNTNSNGEFQQSMYYFWKC